MIISAVMSCSNLKTSVQAYFYLNQAGNNQKIERDTQADRQTKKENVCVRVRASAGKERRKEGKKVLPHRKNRFQFMLNSGES